MTPAKPISNIHAIALLLLIGGVACSGTETRSSAVTTSSPAGTSTAPSANAAASRDEALVRVVHAIPNGAPMDLFAGDLLLFSSVTFKSVSSYRALDGKRYAFALRPAGMTTAAPLSSNTEGLTDGRYYSVFALPGDKGGARLRVVGGELNQPASGKARFPLVHSGDGVGAVDVHAPGLATPLFNAVGFQDVTRYNDVSPISGQIEVRTAGATAPVVMLPNSRVEAGRFYTMVIVGNAPALEAFIIEDMLTPEATSR